jgi:hypothetical protein
MDKNFRAIKGVAHLSFDIVGNDVGFNQGNVGVEFQMQLYKHILSGPAGP